MGYMGLAGALFPLLHYIKIELENEGMNEGNILNYVTVCGIIVLICGFAFDIWRTMKGREDSKKEHESLEKNNNTNKDAWYD